MPEHEYHPAGGTYIVFCIHIILGKCVSIQLPHLKYPTVQIQSTYMQNKYTNCLWYEPGVTYLLSSSHAPLHEIAVRLNESHLQNVNTSHDDRVIWKWHKK